MATKVADAKLGVPPAVRASNRGWMALLAVVLLAMFVALDQWRTVQPLLVQSVVPSVSTVAPTAIPLIAGRNTPQPRNNVGIIPGHNRLRKLANGDMARILEPDPLTGLPPDPGAICKDGTAEADQPAAAAKVAEEGAKAAASKEPPKVQQ